MSLKYLFFEIDPDSEVVVFAKRTVKDLKLPPAFVTQIAQSIQVSEPPPFCGAHMSSGILVYIAI